LAAKRETDLVQFKWDALSDDDFEELCTELMRRKGFLNVRRMSGIGSGDRGRDIHAEENLISATGGAILTRILVQCKNYWGSRTSIGPSDVESLAQRARTMSYDRVLIITSYDLTSQAKTTALDMSTNPSWGIIAEWWSGHDLVSLLLKYPDLRRRFSLEIIAPPLLNIAILDGYASDRTQEKPCAHTFANVSPKDWSNFIQSTNTKTSFISAAEIDTCFDAIVNPFGETYPEENWQSRRTYQRILNYIGNGGLFVNVAGFPFFYYWNHAEGRAHPTGRIRSFFNPTTHSMVNFISWDNTLLYYDFGVFLDPRSPTEVAIFQHDEDRRYVGNLMTLGISSVIEFRAVLAGNPNIIPLVRAEENRIYPLAAIEFGNGHLLVSGLELHAEQAPLVAHTLKNWLLTSGGRLPLPVAS
jgi:hypothetical protein